ncbi:MAG: 6-carboxytetrahydropterin synthase [Flavobacteriales bacterium]|nr:6-carboxytetrahydropterin synthase [Flavobacteriales bacterium]
MVYVTRKLHFNAAHKLYNPNWSKEKNTEIFGKCANEYWHGHNFDLFITVKGIPNPETGYVIDLKVLKDLVEEKVIRKLDHRNLNLDVDFMQGKMASIENLAKAIWEELYPYINAGELYCVKLYETPRQWVSYYGK